MAGHTIAQTERKLGDIAANRALGAKLDYEAMSLVTELSRAAATTRNRIEQGPLATAKLSWSAYLVLWIVWTWQPIETREIAAEAGLGKSALSGVLTTLEKRSLIVRKKNSQDARLVEVALTPAGKKLFEGLLPEVNALETEIAELVHPNNRALLLDTLASWSHPGESNS